MIVYEATFASISRNYARPTVARVRFAIVLLVHRAIPRTKLRDKSSRVSSLRRKGKRLAGRLVGRWVYPEVSPGEGKGKRTLFLSLII